ncbi:MAG TPA: M55 family metallopeptidase [Armatimonadota bacterium]|jgi:D-amino peptidase
MKIYIAADMEGVGGIMLPEQLSRGTAEYAEARQLLTAEVNAAVDGAFEGGATEVIVRDAHGTGFNILCDQFDTRARLLQGAAVPDRFPELEGASGLILLAYHAKAGTQAAVCDHTMSSVAWFRYELCGREVGEVGIDAALAGCINVPVMLVTGDDKVCAEAAALLPGVTTCETKIGLARHAAIHLAPAECRRRIRDAATKAVKAPRPAPFQPAPPYEARVTHVLSSGADGRRYDHRTLRIDARTVACRGDDLRDVIERSLR